MNSQSRARLFGLLACLLPALYFLGTAAFAIVNYQDFASETPQFLRYVLVPGAIGLLLAVCGIAMPASSAAKLGASVGAILAGLFAFEALMTARVVTLLLGSFGAGDTDALQASRQIEGLPPGYTVKRLNRVLEPRELSKAMLSGIPNSDVLLCWRGKEPVFYKADRYGYNNPDAIYGGRLDAIIIGDSFVEGMCQEPGKDIASQLRQDHPASLSFGTRGAGPLFELAVLGRFGKELKPRHVVLAFFEGNDWENLQEELTMPWLRPALPEGADYGPPVMPNEALAEASKVLVNVRQQRVAPMEVVSKTSIVRNFLALNQTMMQLGLAYPKTSRDVPEYGDVLRRAKDLTQAWGGQLTILYIPLSVRYIGALPRHFVYDRLRGKVLAAAADADIDVIDLVELFGQETDPAFFYASDNHLSERGAAFAAAAISRKIGQQPMKSVQQDVAQ